MIVQTPFHVWPEEAGLREPSSGIINGWVFHGQQIPVPWPAPGGFISVTGMPVSVVPLLMTDGIKVQVAEQARRYIRDYAPATYIDPVWWEKIRPLLPNYDRPDNFQAAFRQYLAAFQPPPARLPSLELPKLPKTHRSFEHLNPFFLKYEKEDEASLRLLGSIIIVGTEPVYIKKLLAGFRVITESLEGEKEFNLQDADSLDLRSIEPGFIQTPGIAKLIRRTPARVYKQGVHRDNTILITIPDNKTENIPDTNAFLQYLKNREHVLKVTPEHISLLRKQILTSLRCSNDLAIYTKSHEIFVSFRGRNLGRYDDVLTLDAKDQVPWLEKELISANIHYEIRK